MTVEEFDALMQQEEEQRRQAGGPTFGPADADQVGPMPEMAPVPRAAASPAAAIAGGPGMPWAAKPGPAPPPTRDQTGQAAFEEALTRRGGFVMPAGVDARGNPVAGGMAMVPGRYGPVAAGLSDASPFIHGAAAVVGDQARGNALLGQAEASQTDAEKAFDRALAQAQQQKQFEGSQATEREKIAAQERWHTGDTQQRALDREASLKNQASIAQENRDARTATAAEQTAARKEIADQQAKARLLDQRDRIIESEFGAWRQSPEGRSATPQQVQNKLAQLRQMGEATMGGTTAGAMAGIPAPVKPADPAAENRLAEAVQQGRLAYGIGGVGPDGKPAATDFSSEAGNKFLDLIARGFTPEEQQAIIQQTIGGGSGPGRQVAESIIRAAARAKMRGETKDDLSAGMSPFTPLFGAARAAYNRPPTLAGGAVPGLTVGSNSTAVGRFGRTLLGAGNEGNVYNQANYGGLTVPLDMADVGFNRGGEMDPSEQAQINARLLAAQQTLEFMRKMGYGGMSAPR